MTAKKYSLGSVGRKAGMSRMFTEDGKSIPVTLPEGVEMVMPGDNIKMVVSLINPVAMDEGLRFAIREGGRTVGAGVVAKIIK